MDKFKKLTYLQATLKELGYDQKYIADKRNITPECVSNKFRGNSDWKLCEIVSMLDMIPNRSKEDKLLMIRIFDK